MHYLEYTYTRCASERNVMAYCFKVWAFRPRPLLIILPSVVYTKSHSVISFNTNKEVTHISAMAQKDLVNSVVERIDLNIIQTSP